MGGILPRVVGSNPFQAKEGEGLIHPNRFGRMMFEREQGLHVDLS